MIWIVGLLFLIPNELNFLDSLYKAGDYQTVISRGEEMLAAETKKETQIEILKIIAFANVALDLKDEAKEKFLSLLRLTPKYYLDPTKTSPKIMEVFQAAKLELAKQIKEKSEKKRPDPLFYFYPGLFQIRNEKKTKGFIIFSLQTGSLFGFVTSSILTPIYHQRYLEQTEPTRIEQAYRQYQTVYITRQVFGLGIIASYVIHILDIKFFEPH
ncbi:MAG: hypothetical protein ABIK93_04705 [candidate division WOR-3 bacterium]